MATSPTPSPQVKVDSYLALIPRGLQHAARESISQELSDYQLRIDFVGEPIPDEAGHVELLTSLLKKQQEKGKKKNSDIDPCCSSLVGSSLFYEDKKNASLGYTKGDRAVWACPGVLSGVVWIKIETNAPVHIFANMRSLGPLIALVDIWENIDMPASQSLEEAMQSLKKLLTTRDYPFPKAMEVWYQYVQSTWNLPKQKLQSMEEKMKGKAAMSYRLSCIRNDSEKFKYKRQEFLAEAAGVLVPPRHDGGEQWTVDLTNYDLEVVLLMHPTALAVGLTLRPYQHLGVKSFAIGTIPPDVTPPVLPNEVLAQVIRLRPTTAQLLLHLANIEPGDVVLDPCAGVGTIPIEVMSQKTGAVGLGGDLVLTPEALGPIAASLSKDIHRLQKNARPATPGCSDLFAFDATCLPLRTASVDVVVSDLPFGQKCLSKTKLDGLLPLIFSEMARVVRPQTGRFVFLCGHYVSVVRALLRLNAGCDFEGAHRDVIKMPLDSIFPVNIGGLLAWVVIARRGRDPTKGVLNHRERARKITRKREKSQTNDRDRKKRGGRQAS